MPNDLAKSIEAHRFLHDQGLRHDTVLYGTEPKVVPHELVVSLPLEMGDHDKYGTRVQFIKYLRAVNSVPEEAQEEKEMIRGAGWDGMRVRFRWWTVEGWTRDPNHTTRVLDTL